MHSTGLGNKYLHAVLIRIYYMQFALKKDVPDFNVGWPFFFTFSSFFNCSGIFTLSPFL